MTRSLSALALRLGLAVALLAATVALAACGGDGKSSGDGAAATASTTSNNTAAKLLSDPKLPPAPSDVGDADVRGAQQLLLDRFGTPKFTAPGPNFDKKPAKPVWFIGQTASLPVTQYINKAFLQAAKAAGVQGHVCQGDGKPDRNAICLKQAAEAGAGSAEIFSVDPKTIAKPLAEARKAGVKIVSGNNALRIGEPNPANVDAQVSHDYYDTGVLGAAYAVATWGAKADAMCLAIPEFVVTGAVCEGFEATMKKYCASCKVQTKEIPVAQLADQSAAVVNQGVLQDKGMNYIMGSIDDFCGIIAPTLKRLGKTPEQIACAGQNGNVPSLLDIKKGGYQRMTAGQHTFWWGWAFFDAAARVQVQDMPKAVITAPNTLITRESMKSYNGPIDYNHTAEVFGVPDSLWQDGFKSSWGASS